MKNDFKTVIKTGDSEIIADVAVVGAGAAGIPAAIAAARGGGKVVLLEEDLSIGGAPVDNFVCMPCGWPSMGIYKDMVDTLQNNFSLNDTGLQPDGGRHGIWYLPSSYEYVLNDMIRAEENITLMTGCRVSGVITEDAGNRTEVKGVTVTDRSKRKLVIKAKVTIDATGNGEVASLAGCEFMCGRESKDHYGEPHARDIADSVVMPCTWMYISSKFNGKSGLDFNSLNHRGFIESGHGWHTKADQGVYDRSTGLYLHWGATAMCEDVNDDVKLGETQTEAFEKMKSDIDLLSQNGYAVYLPPKIGVRESRRIKGEDIITECSQRSGVFPDDTVAVGEYWLDIWGEKISREEKQLPAHAITYRSLIPKNYEGLLTAGRCISATHIAMSAIRVQPVAAQMGQAAGVAAALAAMEDTKVRDIEIDVLRNKLVASGIELNKY
ncbi:MAG: FAD-dependent oxidoreductase [Sedimentisphaeraceae bacterium JB056]